DALGAASREVWISDGLRVFRFGSDQKRLRREETFALPGVRQLCGIGDSLFALSGSVVWEIRERALTQTPFRADRMFLHPLGFLALERGDRLLLINDRGDEMIRGRVGSWLSSLIDFPHGAIHVTASTGEIRWYERFVTEV